VSVPVEHLVNGVSIVQCETIERVAYFHLKLDMFHNVVEFAVLYPGEDAPRWAFCAPRLATTRRSRRCGGGSPCAPASRSQQGWFDTAEAGLVRGWARDAANSDMPVPVEVVVDGVVLVSTLAPLPRRSRRPHMLVARGATDGAPLTERLPTN
jgi:hypothetical protein